MKKKLKNKFLIFTLALTGVILFLATSCKKEEDDDNTSLINIPVLTTSDVTNVTQVTALSGGNITSDAGFPIIIRGVCWSTDQMPNIADNRTYEGAGTGSFTSSISGLIPNTTYFVRAYATNSNGTGYGSTMSFMTYGMNTFVDSRDGNVYSFVTIGSQIWMAENLKFLPQVTSPGTLSNTFPYYYVYGYNGNNVTDAKATNNYTVYGALYNWTAVMQGSTGSSSDPSGVQGICPEGWHLPSDAEWKKLEMTLGMTQAQADDFLWRGTDEGGKLKETGTSYWLSPNLGASNETGFSALPGGFILNDEAFWEIQQSGAWWSTTQGSGASNILAFMRRLGHYNSDVYRNSILKDAAFSVRCVMD
jgi:uncharacterized protein (TIGR02145 family)